MARDEYMSGARKKLLQLNTTCMERYEEKEHRIVSTLSFCITALEQLKSWATFAIFPPDEHDAQNYITFVEDRYRCIVEPLQAFHDAVQRDDDESPAGTGRVENEPTKAVDSDALANTASTRVKSPRKKNDLANGQSSPPVSSQSTRQPLLKSRQRLQETKSEADHELNQSLRLDLSTITDSEDIVIYAEPKQAASSATSSTSDSPAVMNSPSTMLRDRINSISQARMEEGQRLQAAVMDQLQKYRREMQVLYRWGQISIIELQELLDDVILEEILFIVRSKVSRILSRVVPYEDAAITIEDKLSSHFPMSNGDKRDERAAKTKDNRLNLSRREVTYEGELITGRFAVHHVDIPVRDSHQLSESLPSRDLEAMFHPQETDSGSNSYRSGGTPEPPGSPRPRTLVNHPKITKDRLQSMALPSKFIGFNPRNSLPY